MKNIALLFIIAVLAGCSQQQGRYTMADDKAPLRLPTAVEIEDIVPRDEPHSRGGNKDYTVRGINYQVLENAKGFNQTGIASWYGSKFHGHLTSNGEVYNMYSLSAAHTSLPLPTYLRVTNLANNKHTIVRVNDRGPFHPDRIIDLSYAAAYKLDILKQGTARVKIEAITPEKQPVLLPPLGQKQSHYFIQLAATGNGQLAREKLDRLSQQHQVTGRLQTKGSIFRVQLGPFASHSIGSLLLGKLKDQYPQAFMLSEEK